MIDPEESVREALAKESPWPVDSQQPVADVVEQRQAVTEEAPTELKPGLPPEADPGDVADQQRVVGYPDDEEEGIE